jgi:hypothetical protein
MDPLSRRRRACAANPTQEICACQLREICAGQLRYRASLTVTHRREVCLSFFPAVVDCQTSFLFFSHNKTASANLLATETITGTRRELVYQLKRWLLVVFVFLITEMKLIFFSSVYIECGRLLRTRTVCRSKPY